MAKANQSSIVAKCASILDILANTRRPLVFTEIVERSGFVKSSAHRILSVLLTEGLAEYDSDSKTYELGPRLSTWTRAVWRRKDLKQVASGELEKLSEITGMNVALSIRDNDSVLYLSTFDTVPVRYAAPAGEHAPLYCTAAGKVFLTFMPEDRRAQLMGGFKYERFTEYTIRDTDTLLEDLAGIRACGYGLCIQEEFFQVMGIAAPIWNAMDEVVASISLWTLTEKTTEEELRSHAAILIATAQEITKKSI